MVDYFLTYQSQTYFILKSKDFSLCVELPIKAKKNGMKIISTSSYERKRLAGIKKVNAIRDGTKILISMIKLFFSNKD